MLKLCSLSFINTIDIARNWDCEMNLIERNLEGYDLKRLIHYLKPHWLFVLLAPLLMVLEVSMDLLQPRLMASIIDGGVMTGNLALIQSTGLKMLFVALIR